MLLGCIYYISAYKLPKQISLELGVCIQQEVLGTAMVQRDITHTCVCPANLQDHFMIIKNFNFVSHIADSSEAEIFFLVFAFRSL